MYQDLSHNLLTAVTRDTFAGLASLTSLDLSYNRIVTLDHSAFAGSPDLTSINLRGNLISALVGGVFSNLSLNHLDLSGQYHLYRIEEGVFQGLDSLTNIILYQTSLTELSPRAFRGGEKAVYLHFFDGNVSKIAVGAFQDLRMLEHLDMTNNSISELRKGMLTGLTSVSWISFSDNPLTYIEPGTFDNMTSVRYINLVNVQLDNLQPETFRGLDSLEGLSTDDYRLCCLFEQAELCTKASSNFLDSCSRLMPNTVLRVALWIIGFGALVGNAIVLGLRARKDPSPRASTQGLFITNLAISDLLMGVYMITIASADTYYGDYFYLYAAKWRESWICNLAGFLAVVSSETSVFMLAVITLDRFLCVVFPFGKVKFHSTSARCGVAVVWIVSFALSIVPIILSSHLEGIYGRTNICIGLPLNLDQTQSGELVFSYEKRVFEFVPIDEEKATSWLYAIILFLGINLVVFILILICYVIIFIFVQRSSKTASKYGKQSSANSRDVKLATRMAIIVMTDFFCWVPVIIMGIVSQSGAVALPVSLYAWSVVFILPINASVNPYLYTFIAYRGRSRNHAATATVKTVSLNMTTPERHGNGTATTDE
ncbi:G-protein coupled receptor GRL101-like [Diadema antillarum]|uniref:G-protein coupled receptor GRL101-like n=1 Tax=Diadema antillarum TaxID=105358 RepID=UPI003A8607C7